MPGHSKLTTGAEKRQVIMTFFILLHFITALFWFYESHLHTNSTQSS